MTDETITIHFTGGSKAVASITEDDLADEQVRVEMWNEKYGTSFDTEISCAEELVESAMSVPPKPGWRWLGDAYVFTQAVSGIEYGDNS